MEIQLYSQVLFSVMRLFGLSQLNSLIHLFQIFREKSSSTQSGIPMKLVPMGLQLSGNMNGDGNVTLLPNSARRLEVLRNCITSIFENKISDAKKTFPAVIGALKTRQARVALCDELAAHKSGNQVRFISFVSLFQ